MEIRFWVKLFGERLQKEFGSRLLFLGLQGSYARGEAGENSDIDVVVILDRVDMEALERYRALLEEMPCREKICGFVSGRREIAGWTRTELFQFCQDTYPVVGCLEELLPPVGMEEARQGVLAGACGIYHMACHNFLHERQEELLCSLLKMARFTMQAKCFCEKGSYFQRREELLEHLSPQEAGLLRAGMEWESLSPLDEHTFNQLSKQLLDWAGETISVFGGAAG